MTTASELRQHTRCCFMILLLTSGMLPCRLAAAREEGPPNIVLILADDMAWADVGYNGQKHYKTPNIDRLAKSGMRFNHAYSGASVCSPTRACLITGMYSPRHNIYHPGDRARGQLKYMRLAVPNRQVKNKTYDWFTATGSLRPDHNSLAKTLKKEGYVSARFGKWHVGPEDLTMGFDISSTSDKPGDTKKHYKNPKSAEQLTNAGIAFMQKHKDRPFFLFVSHFEVHKPLVSDPALVAKYKEQRAKAGGKFNPTYAAMMETIDTSVGRLHKEIKRLKLASNTLLIFTSDNGGYPGATSNRPLHGYKGTLFEGGIRVPTCMVWPGTVKPGSQCNTPITSVDFLPTFAEVAGGSLARSKYPVDGVSFLPLLRGQTIDERAIFWHFPLYADLDGGAAPGTQPIFGTNRRYWRGVPATAIRRGNYKLIHYYETKTSKLFDVVNDIGETRDLATSNPEVAGKLLTELKAWTSETKAPIPTRLNPTFNPAAANSKADPQKRKKKGR